MALCLEIADTVGVSAVHQTMVEGTFAHKAVHDYDYNAAAVCSLLAKYI
jgi:hypothetical protein